MACFLACDNEIITSGILKSISRFAIATGGAFFGQNKEDASVEKATSHLGYMFVACGVSAYNTNDIIKFSRIYVARFAEM